MTGAQLHFVELGACHFSTLRKAALAPANARIRPYLLEIVLIHLDQGHGPLDLHAHAVADHQFRQPVTVD
ncbi:hypothetical protein JCM12107_03180 [Corynebacterium simulans]